MLHQIISEGWLNPMARLAIQPAKRSGDDIAVLDSEDRVQCTFQMLRQQNQKRLTRNMSLADFISPENQDWLGGFCVTAGQGIHERAQRFVEQHDDYSAIMLKALADRIAEA